MKSEILDELEDSPTQNGKPIGRIIQLSVGSIFLFYLIEKARETLPENLFQFEDIEFRTVGILVMIVFILISILIPSNLNKIQPRLSLLSIVIYTGFILLGIEIAFKLLQNLFIFKNNILDIRYIHIVRPAIVMTGIGMAIANIRIHRLRAKKILLPSLLLIVVWLLAGQIL